MARVAVVEDEADIAMLLMTKLRNAGHEVMLARDGAEGLELVMQRKPDMVVLDVTMPKLDGYAVCRQIRGSEETPQPIVVLLSARSQAADRQRGLDAGADDYITKPFRPAELLNRLHELMQRRGVT